MEVFDNRDKPYLAWLKSHPSGFVLNRRRGKSDGYLVLHRATCAKIQDYNEMARPGGFTTRGYIKICADTVEELHLYARVRGGRGDGSFSAKCSMCNPDE
jgi:5-methylcytosine-specific restriction protein A